MWPQMIYNSINLIWSYTFVGMITLEKGTKCIKSLLRG